MAQWQQEHEAKRRIEALVFEHRCELEDDGLDPDEIDRRCVEFRSQLNTTAAAPPAATPKPGRPRRRRAGRGRLSTALPAFKWRGRRHGVAGARDHVPAPRRLFWEGPRRFTKKDHGRDGPRLARAAVDRALRRAPRLYGRRRLDTGGPPRYRLFSISVGAAFRRIRGRRLHDYQRSRCGVDTYTKRRRRRALRVGDGPQRLYHREW